MAIDMNAENSTSLTSPRISFSFDLHHPEDNQNPDSRDSLSSTFLDDDFDFCINSNYMAASDASSTAEDLFLDGKIRSLQLEDKFVIFKHESQDPIPPIGISNPDCSNEIQPENLESEKDNNNQSNAIKRSNSLHCDNTHKKNSFWFSLPLLSRSNSTGSVENQNQNPKSKNLKNSVDLIQSSALSSSSSYRKPPLRKHYVGYKGNNTRINSVLNVPPPRITGNLLGFGAIFGSGDKMKKIKK